MGDDKPDNSAEEGVQIYVLPCTSLRSNQWPPVALYEKLDAAKSARDTS